MSYDLHFTGRDVSAAEFTSYFKSRKRYRGSSPQVIYENEKTGVYFSFEHTRAVNQGEDVDPNAPPSSITLVLNLIRPHIFALEAEPEIRALVDAFRFTVFDPQMEGMGTGAYQSEGFFRGWNVANKVGVQVVLQQNKASLCTYPKEKLERIWKWNRWCEMLQEELQEDIFVPRISFLKKSGMAVSFIVWGDAIPTVIPEVDYILAVRKELAPKGLFKSGPDHCLLSFEEAGKALGSYLRHDFELPVYKLPAPKSPEEIRNYVRRLKPYAEKLEGWPMDKIIDQELVDECLA